MLYLRKLAVAPHRRVCKVGAATATADRNATVTYVPGVVRTLDAAFGYTQ